MQSCLCKQNLLSRHSQRGQDHYLQVPLLSGSKQNTPTLPSQGQLSNYLNPDSETLGNISKILSATTEQQNARAAAKHHTKNMSGSERCQGPASRTALMSRTGGWQWPPQPVPGRRASSSRPEWGRTGHSSHGGTGGGSRVAAWGCTPLRSSEG